MKKIFFIILLLLLFSESIESALLKKTICGHVGKVKTTTPYPLESKDWQCKVKVLWVEEHEDGSIEVYQYIAYPRISRPQDHWMCGLKRNTPVMVGVEYTNRSPNRGKIDWLQVLQ